MELVRLPNVGDRFLDRWTIEAEVGKGGFSIVYRATDDEGRVAALKVLTPEGQNQASSPAYDADLADRFVREARLLDQLDSAYTINLWEYGESDDGLLYMIFEFIDGRMLFDEIKENGAMAHERVIHVMRQTLIALESAHAVGILHRDIKPNNIMLYERDGDPDRVKLVDFGIAKMFDEEKALPGNDLTAAGLLVGTPRYMAPEQLKGHDLTPAADLYSLGLCAIEMLSGRKCIPGKDRVKIVERQLGPKQVVIPDDVKVDAQLEAIVHRLTAKPLHERYRNATDALRDLEQLAGDPGTTGDTLYQDRPKLEDLFDKPVDEDDDTVYETVNSAELAAFLDQQRAKAQGGVGEESSAGIDPFGETMASKASDLLTPELMADLRANDATVEAMPLKRGTAPSQAYGSPEPSGFQKSFDQQYGSGPLPSSMGDGPQPPTMELAKMRPNQDTSPQGSGQFQAPPSDQSYGSGQFGQPPPSQIGPMGGAPADQSAGGLNRPPEESGPAIPFPTPGPPPGPPPGQQPYGSGQFQAPPADQSYGSGQFGQPPMYGSGQYQQPGAYGSGMYPPQGGPPGYGGSGMYQQPPVDQSYGGSGYYQAPGQGPPGYGPPGYGPPGPHGPGGPMMQGPPALTGEDKLALAAAMIVPGVGQILAGQPAKGAIMMGILLALIVFVTVWLWAPIAMLSVIDTFLLVRAQKRRPVEGFEFFPDWRSLL